MPSLLVLILAVELAVQLINTIGAASINNLLWRFVISLPVPIASKFAAQRKQQQEYLAVRRDLNATSSQDEFAKWAKLRRQHDKLFDELERKSTSATHSWTSTPLTASHLTEKDLDTSRASFDRYLTAGRLIFTRGVQWFLPFWYSGSPMFWLPYGWFPYYVEWFASFPRAPLGSVSIVVWQWACYGMLKVIFETVVGIVGLVAAFNHKKRAVPMTNKPTTTSAEKKDI